MRAKLRVGRANLRAGRANLRPMGGDRRKDGRMEIPPCVLQDIGPLGPLPKKGLKRAPTSRAVKALNSRSIKLI